MDLLELKRDKILTEVEINSKKRKIELKRQSLEPGSIDYSKVMVQSTPRNDRQLDVIAEIVKMEHDIDYALKELENINQDINETYNALKNVNDEDSQIYIEKKIYKWSNSKISVRHNGISKRTINRKIKKVEETLKNVSPCPTYNDNMIL